jgi:uncharacterized protein (DUF885 family)
MLYQVARSTSSNGESMARNAFRCFLLVAVLAAAQVCLSASSAAPDSSRADGFARFVDDYFDKLYEFTPSAGTAVGLHQYDHKLEDMSAAAFARRQTTLERQLAELQALRSGQLNKDDSIDALVLDGLLRAELLELVKIRSWTINPMNYTTVPGGAVDGLMKRNFAPASDRLRAVIDRLKAAPALLQAMRENVANPPKEFTDVAIRIADGSTGFFRETVRTWAKEAAGSDANLLTEFDAANRVFISSLEAAAAWLKRDLLPRSRGSYAIGAEAFANKLLYEEMVDIPLDRLLAIGEANLKKDHEAFVATAAKIDPNKSPAEVMLSISDNHPTEEDLVPATKRTIERIRRFLIDQKLVTVPSEIRPTVTETPPYARNGSFASMDTPGPFEAKATEAFYYVTPTEKDWDAKHKEEHLRLFNLPVLDIITIHEAFPGHYIQFLYASQFPTKTRKLATCGSNVEGWAHYTEQMMVDEGYGGGDPRIRLAQLSEALLRDCRYVVGIKLHTQGMTVEEGQKVFVESGFQTPATAYEEARRGAYNPTYLYYTLGKLQILKLREDYRAARGDTFSLQQFHNAFVKQGGIPIQLIRRILLPGTQGPSL